MAESLQGHHLAGKHLIRVRFTNVIPTKQCICPVLYPLLEVCDDTDSGYPNAEVHRGCAH